MKVHLEADAQEILERGPDLIQKLAHRLGVDLSDLIHPDDLVLKAAKAQKEPELRHKPLRQMNDKERSIYQAQMAKMTTEIVKMLDDEG